MQQLFLFINIFKSALHVSGDKFAHPQDHFFYSIYSFWYNAPILLPTGATVEMEHVYHIFGCLHLCLICCCKIVNVCRFHV